MVYHGHVKDGVIVLDGQPRLPEGAAVRVDVVANGESVLTEQIDGAAKRREGETVWDRLLKMAGTVTDLPPDASENLDHYLYDAQDS